MSPVGKQCFCCPAKTALIPSARRKPTRTFSSTSCLAGFGQISVGIFHDATYSSGVVRATGGEKVTRTLLASACHLGKEEPVLFNVMRSRIQIREGSVENHNETFLGCPKPVSICFQKNPFLMTFYLNAWDAQQHSFVAKIWPVLKQTRLHRSGCRALGIVRTAIPKVPFMHGLRSLPSEGRVLGCWLNLLLQYLLSTYLYKAWYGTLRIYQWIQQIKSLLLVVLTFQ